jgi:hypothetical protein
MQIPSPKINLDLGATVQQPFALSSDDSAHNRDKDKYSVDTANIHPDQGPNNCDGPQGWT